MRKEEAMKTKPKRAIRWEIPGTPESVIEEKEIRQRQRRARAKMRKTTTNSRANA